MGTIRITILGGAVVGSSRDESAGMFTEIFVEIRHAIELFNSAMGTNHGLAEVVYQHGVGGIERFYAPQILLTTARVGDPMAPMLTFDTIGLIMEHAVGNTDHKVFLVDEIPDPDHQRKVREFFRRRGLGNQVYLCHSLEPQHICSFRIAIYEHLEQILLGLTEPPV